jgi:hypothetical protein
MNDLLARLARAAGVGHELASRIDAVEWHWSRPWVLWTGLVLLVPLSWWICRRHEQRLPWLAPRLRRALDVCRIGVLALLVFVLAGPFLRLDERIVQKPVVALIVDESDSMELPVGRLPTAGIDAVADAVGLPAPADGDGAAEALVETLGRMSRREFATGFLATQSDRLLASASRSRCAGMRSPGAPPAAPTPAPRRRPSPTRPLTSVAEPIRRSARGSRWPSTMPPIGCSGESSSSPTADRPSASIRSTRFAAPPRPPVGNRARR